MCYFAMELHAILDKFLNLPQEYFTTMAFLVINIVSSSKNLKMHIIMLKISFYWN